MWARVIPTIPPRALEEFTTVDVLNAPEDLPEGISKIASKGGMNDPSIVGSEVSQSVGEVQLNSTTCESDCGGGVTKRKIKSANRRLSVTSDKCLEVKMKKKGLRLLLGKGAKKDFLNERACPGSMSPKREIPMEVDVVTPAKRKRKEAVVDTNQQLITDVWSVKKEGQ